MGGTYQDLKAWQVAMDLVIDVYRNTAEFPREERFGLTSQLRRAAVSVASNIAEGKGRFSNRELAQFLAQARGSVFEIETQVVIAFGLGFLSAKAKQELLDRCAEVGRILNGLIKSLRGPLTLPPRNSRSLEPEACWRSAAILRWSLGAPTAELRNRTRRLHQNRGEVPGRDAWPRPILQIRGPA